MEIFNVVSISAIKFKDHDKWLIMQKYNEAQQLMNHNFQLGNMKMEKIIRSIADNMTNNRCFLYYDDHLKEFILIEIDIPNSEIHKNLIGIYLYKKEQGSVINLDPEKIEFVYLTDEEITDYIFSKRKLGIDIWALTHMFKYGQQIDIPV